MLLRVCGDWTVCYGEACRTVVGLSLVSDRQLAKGPGVGNCDCQGRGGVAHLWGEVM